MLNHLTDAQRAILPDVRDEWLAVGLSTAPADRPAAEDGVRQAYATAGLPPPEIIIWLDSPLAGAIAAAMMTQVGAHVGGQVREQVWKQAWKQVGEQVGDQALTQVRAQVTAQVWDQVRAQTWDQVGEHVWGQVRDQVGEQVRAQVEAQVRDQIWEQVGDPVRDQVGVQIADQVWNQVGARFWEHVRDQIWAVVYGQHDAAWLAFYDALHRLGVDCSQLAGLWQVARSAGWWWPLRSAVILTDRPCVLHQDAQNRLHCADGPAIQYRDGFGVWAWHGVRVPPRVIEAPETITAAEVWAEQNAEIRRVMIERVGYERLIRESGAQLVHRDDWGTLWRCPVPDDDPIWLVEAINSTAEPDGSYKRYFLRVDPELRPLLAPDDRGRPRYGAPQETTALNAIASTFGLTGAEYAGAMVTQS